MNDTMKIIHNIQLDMMDNIHQICLNNGLHYYMVGGTLIGAIRHKGFIPWDLDIDIALPRDDYEKLKACCLNGLEEQYEYLDYCIINDFNKPHAIVRKKNTSIQTINDKKGKYDYGIFIDIFPLDYVPKDKKARNKIKNKLKIYKLVLYYKTSEYNPKKIWKRMIKILVRFFLKAIPFKWLHESMQKLMQSCKGKSDFLCNYAGAYSIEKESHSVEVWGEPTKVEFCSRYYFAPEHSHEYLTRVYGDYLQLPTEDEQKKYMEYYEKVIVDKKDY